MQKRTEHTPESWTVVEGVEPMKDWTESSFIIRAPSAPGGVACTIGGLGKNEERANAYLLAAAPTMFAVLEKIRNLYMQPIPPEGREAFLNGQVESAAKLASTAIAVAKNKQQDFLEKRK